VTVITGFLGSGKTTLLSKVLPKPGMQNAAVIINEFGEIGLDQFLVTKPKEDMVLLDSGCLCCTIRGDLVNTLGSLMKERANGEIPAFDRVLIETTGLADPVPVLMTVTGDSDFTDFYRLDGVITVVDAVNGPSQLDDYKESVKQVAVADRLLISKVDLVDQPGPTRLEGRLHRLNPGAQIYRVLNGEIAPDLLFGIAPQDTKSGDTSVEPWLRFDDHRELDRGEGSDPQIDMGVVESGHSHHDQEIQCFAFEHEGPVSPTGLRLWIDMLGAFRGPNLLRIKGLVNVGGMPVVVQAVQHLFHPPAPLDSWPSEDHRSRLVFITRNLERHEIERTFKAFEYSPAMPEGEQEFDTKNYAQFLEIVRHF
jgi:G3E family GTPase